MALNREERAAERRKSLEKQRSGGSDDLVKKVDALKESMDNLQKDLKPVIEWIKRQEAGANRIKR